MRSNTSKCNFIHVFLICTEQACIWPYSWISNNRTNPYEKVKEIIRSYSSSISCISVSFPGFLIHRNFQLYFFMYFWSLKILWLQLRFLLKQQNACHHSGCLHSLLSWRTCPCPLTLLCLPGLDKVALLKTVTTDHQWLQQRDDFPPICHFHNGIIKMHRVAVFQETR